MTRCHWDYFTNTVVTFSLLLLFLTSATAVFQVDECVTSWPCLICQMWPAENLCDVKENNNPNGGAKHKQATPSSIHLANVQSLENKLDDLRGQIRCQEVMKDCCIVCLTKTSLILWCWTKPSSQLDSFPVFHKDRMEESGKSKGGGVS